MQITKQLAIFLENRPGTLARVCDALAEAKINIFAVSTSDTVDHTVIRMGADGKPFFLCVHGRAGVAQAVKPAAAVSPSAEDR